MIRHVVSWALLEKDAGKKAENAAFVAGQLLSLPPIVPEIRAMTVTPNVLDIEGNWDLVLIADFDDEAALRSYIGHPEHQKVVAVIKPYFEKRSAVDFTL